MKDSLSTAVASRKSGRSRLETFLELSRASFSVALSFTSPLESFNYFHYSLHRRVESWAESSGESEGGDEWSRTNWILILAKDALWLNRLSLVAHQRGITASLKDLFESFSTFQLDESELNCASKRLLGLRCHSSSYLLTCFDRYWISRDFPQAESFASRFGLGLLLEITGV